MGLFLALSGIAGVTTEQVEKALAEYATKKHGVLEPAPGDARPEDVMVVAAAPRDRVTVVYPGDFMEWDEISAHLSHTLQKPVLSFHIHDGDFWMYTFFANGNEVDWFNPVPEYWGDISDEETRKWVGNVGTLCQYWPDTTAGQIDKYLVHWALTDCSSQERKAYPDDEFNVGQDWQLCDFMKKLGLTYPIDETCNRLGKMYTFTVDTPTPKTVTVKLQKPWWKFW